MVQPNHALPLGLDIRDADFSSQVAEWASSAISEIVVVTHEEIAKSRALMLEMDRLLAGNRR